MPWTPSDETLRVLKQVGYSDQLLGKSIVDYRKGGSGFPSRRTNTDHDFFSFLRHTLPLESTSIEARLQSLSGFSLTKLQSEELIGMGYCSEIIDNQVAHFVLEECQNGAAIVSRYGLFKDYLKRRIPLSSLDPASWYPSKALVGTIFTELLVNENEFNLFFDSFLAAVEKRNVASYLLPTFFFNFIKKNQRKIMDMGAALRRRNH
jgi:hypothetical protein